MMNIIRVFLMTILCVCLASCQMNTAEKKDFEKRVLNYLSEKYDQNFTIVRSEWHYELRLWEASVRSLEHPHLRITVRENRDKSLQDDYLSLLWLEQAKPVVDPLIRDAFQPKIYSSYFFYWIPPETISTAGLKWKRNQYPTYHDAAKKGETELIIAISIDQLAKKTDLAQRVLTLREKLLATGIMKSEVYLSYTGEITEKEDEFFRRRSLDLPLDQMTSLEAIIQAMNG